MLVLTLVGRARRRLLGNELLAQGVNVLSVALAVLILLLVLGTRFLDWRWALLLPLAASAAGLYRARKRLPDSYPVAQILDRRMSLADTLSTALYFSQGGPRACGSPEIRKCQLQRANRMAESADVRKAIPYTMPRGMYAMAALLVVASSLFALRYGLSRRLDMIPPLARMVQQALGLDQRTEVARDTGRRHAQSPEKTDDGVAADQPEPRTGGAPDPAAADPRDGNSQAEAQKGAASQGDSNKQAQDQNAGEGSEDAQAENSPDTKDGGNNGGGQSGEAKAEAKQSSGAKQDATSSGENSSLLSKVKDAVQNLLSRVKPQQGNSTQQQNGSEQNGQQGKGQQGGGKQQQSARNGQPSSSAQQGDSEDGQSGQQGQSAQDQQGRGTGKNDAPPGKQPGSGIGSQDGDKAIKQAEQLAAMGKLSEIYGRRSANLTGEATVEVQSTSQQLRTPYAARGTEHHQSGAEISRDEIPAALQAYVEQYFEQVRKQSTRPTKK